MTRKEVEKHIETYILDNFDDRWSPKPTYIYEYQDYYSFGFTSKKFWETKDPDNCFIGLGGSFISKKHCEIVQFGSAMWDIYALRDFLLTEYKLNIVRTKYEIHRYNSHFTVTLNIKNVEKAKICLKGLHDVYTYNEIPNTFTINQSIRIENLDYFGLLNLLYFNCIDPFCICDYQLLPTSHKPFLYQFDSYNNEIDQDILFQDYMIQQIQNQHPKFNIYTNYQVKIIEIYHHKTFEQYIYLSLFQTFDSCEQTGYIGYGKLNEESIKKILNNDGLFEYVEGKDFLFILFMNSVEPFCKFEIKELPKSMNEFNH